MKYGEPSNLAETGREECIEKSRETLRVKVLADSESLRRQAQSAKHPPVIQKWVPQDERKSDGKISAKELQQAFQVHQGKHFSDNVCKFIVRLFDLDKNGGIDVQEFEQMFFCVKEWISAFNACDRNRSGYLTEAELEVALKHMDINCNPEFVSFLITRSDPLNKRMSLDQFIINCVQMQRISDEFRARDEKADGIIKLRYEDFLELVMKSV